MARPEGREKSESVWLWAPFTTVAVGRLKEELKNTGFSTSELLSGVHCS